MFIPERAARRGFSLVEVLVFVVVVSIAVVGVVRVLVLTTSVSVDPQLRKQALAIAESMMEEIQMARFTYCDPTDDGADTSTGACTVPEVAGQEGGAVDRPFDNVNDYVSAYGTAKPYTTDAAGIAFPAGYTAQVTISSEAGLGPAGARISQADATAASINVLHINVVVNYQSGAASVVLDGYRTRYAPTSLP